MLPTRLLEAWANRTHVVLGRRLRDYCLWHRFALEAIDSPFLETDGRPQIGDLDIAVKICCSSYPAEGSSNFFADAEGSMNLWKKLRIATFTRRFKLETEGGKFTAYVRDFHSPPEFWQPPTASPSTSGAPPEIIAIVTQLMCGGFSEGRAWTMPIGQAYWHSATLARQAGAKIVFVSETPELFTGIARLIDLHKNGKLQFHKQGILYTP